VVDNKFVSLHVKVQTEEVTEPAEQELSNDDGNDDDSM
jgi:hypothetical protein